MEGDTAALLLSCGSTSLPEELVLVGAGDETLPVTGDEEVEESPKTRGSRATAWLQASTCPVAGTRLTYSL